MSSEPHTRVYLARHCDVRNPDRVLYGHLPNFPLSEKGVRQAHALGSTLAATSARQIFTSPLERARQTAEIIAGHIPGSAITVTDDLIEARFGLYLQGVQPKHVPWRRPLWLIHMVWPGLLPNDERVDEMAARVERPIRQILTTAPEEGGICVSHGDPIQAFWVRSEGRPAWALHRLQCAKGGMLELDYAGGQLRQTTYRPPRPDNATAVPSSQSEAGDVV
ncbi:MAG TPA: histidine phosphatase family protein [Candidatus Dormibacteraeota bacterium]|nr:histidine phosphatase family protein [Candidatus Dormibacteraeota bacterium]